MPLWGKWQILYLRTRYRFKSGWFFWFGPIRMTICRNLVCGCTCGCNCALPYFLLGKKVFKRRKEYLQCLLPKGKRCLQVSLINCHAVCTLEQLRSQKRCVFTLTKNEMSTRCYFPLVDFWSLSTHFFLPMSTSFSLHCVCHSRVEGGGN